MSNDYNGSNGHDGEGDWGDFAYSEDDYAPVEEFQEQALPPLSGSPAPEQQSMAGAVSMGFQEPAPYSSHSPVSNVMSHGAVLPPVMSESVPSAGPAPQRRFVRMPAQGGVGAFPKQAEESHFLGISILSLAIGGTLGAYYAPSSQLWGSLAGSLVGGAAVNGLRAYSRATDGTPEGKKEATVSVFYAVMSAGLGAFIWYKFVPRSGAYAKNEGEAPQLCGPRKAS